MKLYRKVDYLGSDIRPILILFKGKVNFILSPLLIALRIVQTLLYSAFPLF